ncbi:peroxidase family protein [Planctobacterium marinum]|uniref:Peroxidase n=1 Tax=Planctobacterium marinum TaxID=1631968 RepID=A0AA48I0B8_9ALTE|nr:hypothetical protein MACH26_34360 [Planctobacterium marinum]
MRYRTLVISIAIALNGFAVTAQQNDGIDRDRGKRNSVSPVRNIERDRPPAPDAPVFGIRSYDGSNNNLDNPEWGKAHIQLQRYTAADYSDGISSLAGENRPSAREISNLVFAQNHDVPNAKMVTDFMWQWGQFLDHDIDLTDGIDPEEPANINVPTGDVFFDPQATGIAQISLNRSLYDVETGTGFDNPRQQVNEISAWIDASNVYGSSTERANALRTLDGTGRLKTSEGNLLPFNDEGLANAGGTSAALFLAGDVRANEQVGLATMHTLFVREHNRQIERIKRDNPDLSGEELYQQARAIVAAQMQVITYNEFLPLLLGRDALPRYHGYNPEIDASIANEFSTGAYRLGHSLLSPQLLRLDENGEEIEAGHLSLRDAFFRPSEIINEGLEPVLRGLATQICQSIDNYVIDDVRNFLFGAPGAGGFDLVSLNIQRGRDHGLSGYNQTRLALGLSPVSEFTDVSSDPLVSSALADAYETVDDIDLWVGGLAEDHHQDAMVGELFFHILRRQFLSLRDGDRFWYQNIMSERQANRIEETRLSDIIRRNTDVGRELQRNVFLSPEVQDRDERNSDSQGPNVRP